mgnify:CR=1 FL=1
MGTRDAEQADAGQGAVSGEAGTASQPAQAHVTARAGAEFSAPHAGTLAPPAGASGSSPDAASSAGAASNPAAAIAAVAALGDGEEGRALLQEFRDAFSHLNDETFSESYARTMDVDVEWSAGFVMTVERSGVA